MKKLIGPFSEILPLSDMPINGSIDDSELRVISNGGVIVENGNIVETG